MIAPRRVRAYLSAMTSFQPAPRGAPIRERLARFPFLEELPPPALDALASRAHVLTLEVPTALVGPGQPVTLVPLVERGSIRVERAADDTRRIGLYRVAPGESCVLALSGVIRGEPYPAEAIAEAGTVAIGIPADALAHLFEREPALRRFVLDLYAARLFDLMHLVREVSFERLPQRIAKLLLRESDAGAGLVRPIARSHAAIAAQLGTAREVVTRELATLRDAGVVELGRGRITVTDVAGLRALAGRAEGLST